METRQHRKVLAGLLPAQASERMSCESLGVGPVPQDLLAQGGGGGAVAPGLLDELQRLALLVPAVPGWHMLGLRHEPALPAVRRATTLRAYPKTARGRS